MLDSVRGSATRSCTHRLGLVRSLDGDVGKPLLLRRCWIHPLFALLVPADRHVPDRVRPGSGFASERPDGVAFRPTAISGGVGDLLLPRYCPVSVEPQDRCGRDWCSVLGSICGGFRVRLDSRNGGRRPSVDCRAPLHRAHGSARQSGWIPTSRKLGCPVTESTSEGAPSPGSRMKPLVEGRQLPRGPKV